MNSPRRHFPSLSALRALESVDRLGSASAAAQDLNLTQSAVSRQLQALESQLNVPLMDRSHRRLTLTPEAQSYITDIRPALTQIAQATLNLQVPQTAGSLNLAILPAFGMRWLMPKLPDFARLHPDVTINMSTRLEPFNFASELFDAALWYGTGDWPDTQSLLLKHEQVIPVCAPDLAARIAKPADLLKHPLLHIRSRPAAWSDWFTAKSVPLSKPIPGTLYDQFSTITQAALHGLGVALMPDYLVEQDIATGKLAALFGPALETKGAYYLAWSQTKATDPALTLFKDWLSPQTQPEDPLPR